MDNEESPRPRRTATKPDASEASQPTADQGAAPAQADSDEAVISAEPMVKLDRNGREHPMVGGTFIRAKDGTLTRTEA